MVLCQSGVLPLWDGEADDFNECWKKVVFPSAVAGYSVLASVIALMARRTHMRRGAVQSHYSILDTNRMAMNIMILTTHMAVLITGVCVHAFSANDVFYLASVVVTTGCGALLLHREVR